MNPRAWLRGEPCCTEVAKHQAGNSAREWTETALEGIVDPGLAPCMNVAPEQSILRTCHPTGAALASPELCKPHLPPQQRRLLTGLQVHSNPSHYRLSSPFQAQRGSGLNEKGWCAMTEPVKLSDDPSTM